MSEQILKLSKGNKVEFMKIFHEFYQPLYHLGLTYLEDKDETKEVVQDAFVKLWEIRQKLDPESNLKNYLFTLVKNNCLNILKRRQIILKHHENIRWMEMHYQYESLTRINDDYLEFAELKGKIKIAINKLPEQCRAVFEMSRFEDMKNREIAEKMGISLKTVEAHMTKALKILRKELKDFLPIIISISEILN